MISILLLVDGLGDTASPSPLEAAATPELDALAAEGVSGLMDPVAPGIAPGSDTAHLSMLGADPRTYYTGRGAFECLGSGLDMQPGDVAFKCNFCLMDEASQRVERRRCDRAFVQWGVPLCDALDGARVPGFEDVQVAVRYATEHRCTVRLRHKRLSDAITGTDPLRDGEHLLTCEPLTEEAAWTARLVNALHKVFQRLLLEHRITRERRARGLPYANAVLLRGAGALGHLPSFKDLHGFRHSFMIAPTAIIAGVGRVFGLRIVRVEGATGDASSDWTAKARACCAEIDSLLASREIHDDDEKDHCGVFAFVHVKAVDDAGHDGDPNAKRMLLERLDHELVGPLRRYVSQHKGAVLAVTGDHTTPCVVGDHSCEPVPFLVGPVRHKHRDDVRAAGERHAAKGGLGRFPGSSLVPLLKRVAHEQNKDDGV